MVSDILFGAVMGTAQALSSKRDFEREVFAADRERAARMEELREQYRIQGENQLAVERERIKQQEMKQQAETGEKVAQLQNMFGSMFPNESAEVIQSMAVTANQAGMTPSMALQPGANVVVENFRNLSLQRMRMPSIPRSEGEQGTAQQDSTGPAPLRTPVNQTSLGEDISFPGASSWQDPLNRMAEEPSPPPALAFRVISSNDPKFVDRGAGGSSYDKVPLVPSLAQAKNVTNLVKERLNDFSKQLERTPGDIYGQSTRAERARIDVMDQDVKASFQNLDATELNEITRFVAESLMYDKAEKVFVESANGFMVLDQAPFITENEIIPKSKTVGLLITSLKQNTGNNRISKLSENKILDELSQTLLDNTAYTQENPPTYQDLLKRHESALSTVDTQLGEGTSKKLVALYLSNFYGSPNELKDPRRGKKDPWNGAVEWAFKVRGITPANQASQEQPEAPQSPRDRMARVLGVRPEDMPADEQAPAPQQQRPLELPERTADTLTGNTFETMRPAFAEKMKVKPEDIVRIDASRKDRAVTVYLQDGTVKQFYARSK